jgi:hypothetical protein
LPAGKTRPRPRLRRLHTLEQQLRYRTGTRTFNLNHFFTW